MFLKVCKSTHEDKQVDVNLKNPLHADEKACKQGIHPSLET